MKKHSIFAAVLLSLGMLVFSCNKVESDIQGPEEIIDNAQPVEMTFTATVSAKDATTKSVDASGVTAWVAGEQMAVYYQKSDNSYATATATVGTPNGDGSAPISATLSDAKNGSTVKFVYPAGLADASGDIDAAALAAQHGTIADISENFDAATGSGTLVTDGTSCGTSAQITMTNKVLIGKFTPKYSDVAIDAITRLIISDGTNTYTITPEAPATEFDDQGIYVAMLPVANKLITITAETGAGNYAYYKSGITLAVGKLYNNLAIPMKPATFVTTSTADALRTTLTSVTTGSVIVMAAGTYVETNSNYIAFDKDVIAMAAPGASVTLQPKVPIQISDGGKATLVGIKIDASKLTELASWYEHIIYPSDANAANSLVMESCEMYGFSLNKSAIYCSSSNKFASVSLNNCYFHDIMKSCVFLEGVVGSFSLTNSTIANISTETTSYWAGIFDIRETTAEVRVDHCTFYNCMAMNTDYGAIGKCLTADTIVSNCIFMMPTSTDALRAFKGISGSQANYCMINNYLKDSGWGIHSDVTKTSCVKDTDPKFVDAPNGDFTLGAGSPALTASATSGPIGDPRWY